MRDPKRIHEFCEELERVWSLVPDGRFGQIVVNVLGVDPFYIEDDKSISLFKTYREQLCENSVIFSEK